MQKLTEQKNTDPKNMKIKIQDPKKQKILLEIWR